MSEVLDALKWRYAVKKFNPARTLTEKQVQGLREAFNLTATSYGLQPIKMLMIRDKELQESLVPHSYGQRQVADASHLMVLCIEMNIDQAYIEGYFERVRNVRGTPEEVLKPFKDSLSQSFQVKAQTEIRTWATHQAYLAMGNLLTYCAYERIDACPMEGFAPEAYNDTLGLPEMGLSAVLALPVGYRAEDDMFSGFKKVRKDLEDAVIDMLKK